MSDPPDDGVRTPSILTKIAAAVFTLITIAIIAIAWRELGLNLQHLIDLVLIGWILWLHLDRANIHDKTDTASNDADEAIRRAHEASEDADLAVGTVNRLVDHLEDHDTPTGRHAHTATDPTPMP